MRVDCVIRGRSMAAHDTSKQPATTATAPSAIRATMTTAHPPRPA